MKKLDSNAGTNSKLPNQVQDLIKMIFDVESMKKAMLEFEVNDNLALMSVDDNFMKTLTAKQAVPIKYGVAIIRLIHHRP